MDRDDRLARCIGSWLVSCCVIHADGSPSVIRRGCGHGSDFLRIDTHSLAYAALNVSPLFAGTFHAPPNGHGALLFGVAEIVNQTHGLPPPFGPSVVNQGSWSGMQAEQDWKLLDLRFCRFAPNRLSSSGVAALSALMQAARRASRPCRPNTRKARVSGAPALPPSLRLRRTLPGQPVQSLCRSAPNRHRESTHERHSALAARGSARGRLPTPTREKRACRGRRPCRHHSG
jgi:hypothetical protein